MKDGAYKYIEREGIVVLYIESKQKGEVKRSEIKCSKHMEDLFLRLFQLIKTVEEIAKNCLVFGFL